MVSDLHHRTQFFSNDAEDLTQSDIQTVVLRSWNRLKQSGLAPMKQFQRPTTMRKPDLSSDLVALFRSIGPRVRQATGDPDNALYFLTDRFGNLSTYDAGEQIYIWLQSQGWGATMSFHEKFVGTNAVDACLREREPVTTISGDHTCDALTNSAIHAIPLIGRTGDILGCLALIMPKDCLGDGSRKMVALSATLMEGFLRATNTSSELKQHLAELHVIADAVKEGIMVVNREGTLEYMNKPAGRILGVDPKQAIGQPLAEVVGFDPVINPVFKTGEGYSDEEVHITTHKKKLHLIDTAVPIMNGAGEVVSIVNSFREFGRIIEVARKFNGNQAHYTFDSIIGRSPAMLSAVEISKQAAKGTSNILLSGESGTGKELFAQSIHSESTRANGPFVAINCAALPKDLIESELFGYVAGSFTGAHQSGRPGKFEIASGGTIFLDEISEMPLDVQAKLLRVLQEREVTRVGGSGPLKIDVRFITAMNRDIRELVANGNFREDLYYRINVIEIPIPALRERHGDVGKLAQHYLMHYADLLNKNVTSFAPGVLDQLNAYDWPGNVRELQNAIERMVNFADGSLAGGKIGFLKSGELRPREITVPDLRDIMIPLPTLAKMEEMLIMQALERCNFNVTQAADMLGMTKPRVYRKIQLYDIKLKRNDIQE